MSNLPHPLGPFVQRRTARVDKEGFHVYVDTKVRVGEKLAKVLSDKSWRGFKCTLGPGQDVRIVKGSAEIVLKVPHGVDSMVYLREVLKLVKVPKRMCRPTDPITQIFVDRQLDELTERIYGTRGTNENE